MATALLLTFTIIQFSGQSFSVETIRAKLRSRLHSLETLGKADEAVAEVRRALDKNPLSTVLSSELGCASYYAHHYDQTIDFSRETLKSESGYPLAHYNTARALGQLGQYDQAISELDKPIKFDPLHNDPHFISLLKHLKLESQLNSQSAIPSLYP